MILTVTLNTAVDKLYLVDAMQPGTVMRVKEVSNTAGGKGLNVSRVAALSGEDVTAMGFVGGFDGMLFESLITQPNLHKAFTRVQGNTRSCINIRDLSTGKSTEFLEPGEPVTAQEVQQFLQAFGKAVQVADVVTISGSMPRGVPADFYTQLIGISQKYGKPVLLDTSGSTLKNTLGAHPAMIKPNTEEIGQIMQVNIENRQQLIQAAEQLHKTGIPVVAVSLGRDGVLVVCREGVFHGITPDIPVVNTVGSGDSMVAGFAVSFARGESMQQAIHFAVCVSTANALCKQTGFYRQEDLAMLRPLVRVEQLA